MSTHPLSHHPGILPAHHLAAPAQLEAAHWDCATLAGHLTELSAWGASACLTLAFALVLDSQRQGEAVAWVGGTRSGFFPPDAAAGGVDLEALVVVRVDGVTPILRAADHLARSGAFGLLVLDFGHDARLPAHAQSRLGGLASRHASAILCLTQKREQDPSLGSLISLRGAARRTREGDNRFQCQFEALKDKRHGPGWSHAELCCGPDGLR